jgi:predicted glycosyltransferase
MDESSVISGSDLHSISSFTRFFADVVEEDFDFRPDPEMFNKLGIKKARRIADLASHDLERIYYYNVGRDVEQIREKT